MSARKPNTGIGGRLTALILFAVAMALLEAAVVVYLRHISYPDGFSFPLRAFPPLLLITEIWREAATIIMLLLVAWLFGNRWTSRLGGFLMAFAVWDIWYYIFLWLLLGWPESLLTWDLLFLIPAPWTGPVIAPVLNSVTMIVMATGLIRSKIRMPGKQLWYYWLFCVSGSLVTIFAYVWPWIDHMLERFTMNSMLRMDDSVIFSSHASTFVPENFPWLLFLAGEALFIAAVTRVYRK